MQLCKDGLTNHMEPTQDLGAGRKGLQRGGRHIPREMSKKQMPLQLADKWGFEFGKAETPVVLHIVPEHEK